MLVCFPTRFGNYSTIMAYFRRRKTPNQSLSTPLYYRAPQNSLIFRLLHYNSLTKKSHFLIKRITTWMSRMTNETNLLLVLVFPFHILSNHQFVHLYIWINNLASEWSSCNMCLYNRYTLFHYCDSFKVLSPGNSEVILLPKITQWIGFLTLYLIFIDIPRKSLFQILGFRYLLNS